MNKYWLETSKETERAIALCYTGSTIISILSESHQDLSVTETFFWKCHFLLWCNSCGDTRIVYKSYLHCGNVVAKESDVVTTTTTKHLKNIGTITFFYKLFEKQIRIMYNVFKI